MQAPNSSGLPEIQFAVRLRVGALECGQESENVRSMRFIKVWVLPRTLEQAGRRIHFFSDHRPGPNRETKTSHEHPGSVLRRARFGRS